MTTRHFPLQPSSTFVHRLLTLALVVVFTVAAGVPAALAGSDDYKPKKGVKGTQERAAKFNKLQRKIGKKLEKNSTKKGYKTYGPEWQAERRKLLNKYDKKLKRLDDDRVYPDDDN